MKLTPNVISPDSDDKFAECNGDCDHCSRADTCYDNDEYDDED